MDRWIGKVALVTGASAGIGASITIALANNGMKVIAAARRMDKLEKLAASLNSESTVMVYPMKCDVRKEEDILKIFKWAEKELGGIDVLINNAGVVSPEPIIEGSTEDYHKIMDVNVIAVAICSREFVQSVKRRKSSGHIININSIMGHFTQSMLLPMNLYGASKCAITGMTQSLRNELMMAKIDVKVTSISPGVVKTDMMTRNGTIPDEMFKGLPVLRDKDIADSVLYALNTPHNTQVCELIITPHEALCTVKNPRPYAVVQ